MGLAALKTEDLPHYTYDDYAQWEGKWELINGIPFAMTPSPAFKHQLLSQNIGGQLYRLLKKCKYCTAVLPVDWQIDEDTVVQPDNLVVCGENIKGEKLTTCPVLVFEVLSPTSARKDRMLKYNLYENAGVKYYCLVDPDDESTDVFELIDKKYQKVGTFKKGKRTLELEKCNIKFDFGEIFE